MKYNFEDYNEYHVLKIPSLLIVLNIYLLKYFVIFLLPMISAIPFFKTLAHDQFHIALLTCSLPAVFVLISMIRRVPSTKSVLLIWFWKNANNLLLFSLISELVLLSLFLWFEIQQLNGINLMFIYLDVIFIVYLIRSKRIIDVFAEFPHK
ncbi:DUF2919 family protein [Candidatus Marithrix sp. Canyon 246]|uniref:DUF2919 family protein n=1 Tax=Candidatus Marithrix sp. Canyon 246 TaxID=1827136 RepID=UPI00084A083A|nr:DUF2919 family protein [Candidatus Marithrix sp. Canyon 246]